ncbi:MAG TPA: DUF1698 domain-containing protein [Bryobacteraceae bacterium]|nr:DUF1698 domain-containing protein [Bryobacteraceae bacterium]
MTEAEVRSGIERLGPWFHSIDLGNSISTKTRSVVGEPADHPAPTWQIISRCLPLDLTGKTVLDVGCNAGFYSVAAKRRNAARVLGVDAQRGQVRQAKFVRRVLGLDIEYERVSVYDLDPRQMGRFDITLALGLVYHCKHLVLALEKLFHVTKELLILETAILPPDRQPTAHFLGADAIVHRLAYVENSQSAKEAIYNWFVPSTGALCALLKSTGFQDVDVFSDDGGRAVVLCRKPAKQADSRDLPGLASTLTFIDGPSRCKPGQVVTFRIQVENAGYSRWLSDRDLPSDCGVVRLGCHLLDREHEDLMWDLSRANLPQAVEPGGVVTLDLPLRAPEGKGEYWIEFEMVAEYLSWFEDLGSPVLRHKIIVE